MAQGCPQRVCMGGIAPDGLFFEGEVLANYDQIERQEERGAGGGIAQPSATGLRGTEQWKAIPGPPSATSVGVSEATTDSSSHAPVRKAWRPNPLDQAVRGNQALRNEPTKSLKTNKDGNDEGVFSEEPTKCFLINKTTQDPNPRSPLYPDPAPQPIKDAA